VTILVLAMVKVGMMMVTLVPTPRQALARTLIGIGLLTSRICQWQALRR
jgi:hypothetical protein